MTSRLALAGALCLWMGGSLWAADRGAHAGLNLAMDDPGISLLSVEPEPSVGGFAKAGTWTFQLYGSAAFGDRNGDVFTGHVGVGYHFIDDVSINLEVIVGAIDIRKGDQETATVYGLDLLVRYHFYKHGAFSLYAEGGAGLQQSTEPFPVGGTHFNFRPQAGIGLTLGLSEEVRLIVGARWLHISNADKEGNLMNPGFDAGVIYTGLMIPF